MQQPRYDFYLNPHDEYAWTKCPKCDIEKTKLRKFCFMIHYEDKPLKFMRMLSIRADCRFCTACELVIKKKSEMESILQQMMTNWGVKFNPQNYFIFGTVDKNEWKQGLKIPGDPKAFFEKTAPFKEVLKFDIQPAGWYFVGK